MSIMLQGIKPQIKNISYRKTTMFSFGGKTLFAFAASDQSTHILASLRAVSSPSTSSISLISLLMNW